MAHPRGGNQIGVAESLADGGSLDERRVRRGGVSFVHRPNCCRQEHIAPLDAVSPFALYQPAFFWMVFVALNSTKFEKRPVKTGLEQHGRVQVLEGLKEGEKVVTDGSFILKSEMLKDELGEE